MLRAVRVHRQHTGVPRQDDPARRLTPGLADGLQQSAASFLARQGVTAEPVAYDPPLRLLDGLHLPGTNPNETDLEHLHRLIRGDHASIATAAHCLGTTSETVQLLLHQHPAPRASDRKVVATRSPRQVLTHDQLAQYYLGEHLTFAEIAKRAGLSRGYVTQLARDYGIPARGQKDSTIHQHPVLTRNWLHHQYVTRSRSLQELATDSGMSKSAVRRWAKIYAIPTPPRYPIRMNIAAAAAAAPPLLQPAITGPGAWKRLNRLAAASRYPTLTQAATCLGISPTVLNTQVNRLEHELGQRLLERAPGQKAMRPTPFGRKVITAIRAAERAKPATAAGLRHRPRKMPPS